MIFTYWENLINHITTHEIETDWKTFDDFYYAMGVPISEHAYIKRIDREKPFTRNNCHWVCDKTESDDKFYYLSNDDILFSAKQTASVIKRHFALSLEETIKMFPVPRGGIPTLYAIKQFLPENFVIVDVFDETNTSCIIDDIYDSGLTMKRIKGETDIPHFMLHSRPSKWLVYPWEGDSDSSIEDNVVRLMQFHNIKLNKLDEFNEHIASFQCM